MPIKVFLLFAVSQMVLSPQYMGHSKQMVIYRHWEVHHRINPVFGAYPWMFLFNYSHSHPITNGRILVIYISLDSKHRLTCFHFREPFPKCHILFYRIVSAWARLTAVLKLFELSTITGAHICSPTLDELFSILVIDFKAITLIVHFIRLYSQPFQVFLNQFISWLINTLWICVLYS